MLIGVGIGIVWLALLQIVSGTLYLSLFLGAIGLIYIFRSFASKDINMTLFQRNPFFGSRKRQAIIFIFMFMIPILMFGASNAFNIENLNTAKFSVPLAANQIESQISQTFAQPGAFSLAEVTSDKFVQMFVIVYSASALEEFVFGYGTMILFAAIAMFFLVLMGNPFKQGANTFIFIVALAGSVLAFTGIHMLNGSYVSGWDFAGAALFRLGLNALFWLPLGIGRTGFIPFSGLIAFHQSNNLLYFIGQNGFAQTMSLLFSGFGWFIVAFYAVIIFFVFNNLKSVGPEVKKTFVT